jgi:hypothetical protein
MQLFIDQTLKSSIRLQEDLAKEGGFRTAYATAVAATKSCEEERNRCLASAGGVSTEIFCPEFMRCLSDKGLEDAKGPHPWLEFKDLNLGSGGE